MQFRLARSPQSVAQAPKQQAPLQAPAAPAGISAVSVDASRQFLQHGLSLVVIDLAGPAAWWPPPPY